MAQNSNSNAAFSDCSPLLSVDFLMSPKDSKGELTDCQEGL